jgi:HlyD family secretion protein
MMIGGGMATLVVAVTITGFSLSGGPTLSRSEATLAEVRQEAFSPLIAGTGAISNESGQTIAALEGGVVDQVLHRSGERVNVGEAIVTLANPTLQREVADALMRLESEESTLRAQEGEGERQISQARDRVGEIEYRHQNARNELDRNRQLEERGFASKAKMDRLREDLAFSRQQLDAARSEQQRLVRLEQERGEARAEARRRLGALKALQSGRLDALTIRAPIAGVLGGMTLRQGAPVRPSDVIGQIAVDGAIKVEARAPDIAGNMLKVGGRARLQDNPSATLVVRSIDPEVNQGSLTVRLEFLGPAPPDLKPGQSLQLAFATGEPRRALVLRYGDLVGPATVWVVEKDATVARPRPVRLGERAGDDVEVLGGLKAGDRILIGSARALDGHRRVRLAP